MPGEMHFVSLMRASLLRKLTVSLDLFGLFVVPLEALFPEIQLQIYLVWKK